MKNILDVDYYKILNSKRTDFSWVDSQGSRG